MQGFRVRVKENKFTTNDVVMMYYKFVKNSHKQYIICKKKLLIIYLIKI